MRGEWGVVFVGKGGEGMLLYMNRLVVECEAFHNVMDKID